ncbi:uncharacterized protein [Rutidosis leptorrhynchoides]|uniref:uncharacterized protein n=1 Tax=Rutidosis leptorrhynchoides TaxID=125765 RepID=UPI003A9A32A6
MVASVGEEQPNWMEPILQYIRNNVLPNDKREARLVRERTPMYIIQNDILYRKSYCSPMMQCVGPIEAEMIVDEVHNGSCALHSGYKTISAKIMRMGYFWPSLFRDVAKIVKRCKSCQRHAPQNRMPRHDMIHVNSPWPFHKWAIDIVGPFPAVQKFTSVAHPQDNGLCEVTNRDIVSSIKKRLYEKRTGWVDELPNVLWAHRTTFKKSTKERRFMAAIREANNKQQIAKYYNRRVCAFSFDVGEWVLRNNDASRAEKLGKLGPNWEGPYQVVAINAAGSYKLADIEGKNISNAWHAALLKRYYA